MLDPSRLSPSALLFLAAGIYLLITGSSARLKRLAGSWPVLALAAALAMLAIPKMIVAYIAPCEYFQDTAAAGELLENRSAYPSFHPLIKRIVTEHPPWAPAALKGLQASQSRCIAELELNAHPPFLTVLTEPLVVLLGYYAPVWVMNLLSLVLLGWMVRCFGKFLGWDLGDRATWTLALLSIGSQPVLSTLRNANQSLILAALIVLAWYSLREQRAGRAGVITGVAACLKVFPGIAFGGLLLLSWRAFIAGCATVAAILGGITLLHGPGIFREYLATAELVASWYTWMRTNYSVQANLKYFTGWEDAPVRTLYLAIAAALVLLVGLRLLQTRKEEWSRRVDVTIGLSCCLMCLIPPVVWTHYFSILWLPYALLWWHTRAAENPSRGALLLAMLAMHQLHDSTLEWLALRVGSWIWSIPFFTTIGLFAMLWSPAKQDRSQAVSH